jgi:hypothetical protein
VAVKSRQLDDFAQEARTFCSWATGEDGSTMSIPQALRRVTNLYTAALGLPLPFTQGMSEAAVEIEPPSASMELVSRRAATLPLQVYWEIFAPIEDPPAEPVMGSTVDDLGDMYRDVARGMILFEAGEHVEALWQWAFNFRIHWGEHATSAIRAFHAYLALEDPDGLSEGA